MKIYQIYIKSHPEDIPEQTFFLSAENAQKYCDDEHAKSVLKAKEKVREGLVRDQNFVVGANVSILEHNFLVDNELRKGPKKDLVIVFSVPNVEDVKLPDYMPGIFEFYYEEFETED